jgi:hypothetical protein
MWRRFIMMSTVLLLAVPLAVPVQAQTGFQTQKDPYLTLADGAPDGSSLTPIISVGEGPGDFLFEGIPDGIGLAPGRGGTVETFVAHEQSTVPFLNAADFQDASVSKLVLDTGGATVRGRLGGDPRVGGVHPLLLRLHGRTRPRFLALHILRQRGEQRHHRRAGRCSVRTRPGRRATAPGGIHGGV